MSKELGEIKLKDSAMPIVFLVCYYYVDELYTQVAHLVTRRGTKPTFTDAEVITLQLVGQMCDCDSESAWYRHVRKNYLALFPDLISRSRYHRRSKDLMQITNSIRRLLLEVLGTNQVKWHLMDSMPVPVCVYARAGRNDRFSMDFQLDEDLLYGYCASKQESVYGFKLHLMVTHQGIPVEYVLAPARHHDVAVAPELVESYRTNISIGTDKGYVGLHKRLQRPQDVHLVVKPRDNQKSWLSKEEKAFLYKYRSVVETTNSLLTEQFNIQRTRAISARGLMSRVTAKITSLTLAIFLNFISDEPLLHVKELIF
ncbi:MAG: IS982 family transposase [Bacteroidota bacterium]